MKEDKMKLLSTKRCNTIKTPEEMKKLCEESQTEIVQYIFEKYKNEILVEKTPSKSPTIYIIGGQNASGKSKLISQLGAKNENSVSIIIDDMKAHHPFREYIDKNFPDKSEELLHLACFDVFDRLLNSLLEDKYDIVIERTLGNKDKTKKFIVDPANHGYNIEVHVTATHELNSLLSAIERFVYECKLKDDFDSRKTDLKIEPRPIALSHHDDTYENICGVIQSVESGCFAGQDKTRIHPEVFIWDRTPNKPTNIYTTKDKRFPNAKQAMLAGRDNDLQRCKSNEAYGFYNRIENILKELREAESTSTLSHYQEYCAKFLKELDKRGKIYIEKEDEKAK